MLDWVDLARILRKYSLHVLDDLDCFSDRGRRFLLRAAWRVEQRPRWTATEFLQLPTRSGQLMPAPAELVLRREGFAQKYGGLRYRVRRSVLFPQGRFDSERAWEFDLSSRLKVERHGWSFDWTGERVSAPVWYLAHTDGRIGVSDGGPFLEIAPSMGHLIESHAIMDEVASWDPHGGAAVDAAQIARWIDGLVEVPEASGPMGAWLLSDTVALHTFRRWTSQGPRLPGGWIWTLDEHGRRTVAEALERAGNSARFE